MLFSLSHLRAVQWQSSIVQKNAYLSLKLKIHIRTFHLKSAMSTPDIHSNFAPNIHVASNIQIE